MACGTPIIAFRNGSVPEIVDDSRTGFVVDTLEEAITAVQKIDSIDRRTCRAAFEERSTARRMAQDYLAIYEKMGFDKGGEPMQVRNGFDWQPSPFEDEYSGVGNLREQ